MQIKIPYYLKILGISLLYNKLTKNKDIIRDSLYFTYIGILRNFLLTEFPPDFVNPFSVYLTATTYDTCKYSLISYLSSHIIYNKKIKYDKSIFALTIPIIAYSFVYKRNEMGTQYYKFLCNFNNTHDKNKIESFTNKLKNGSSDKSCEFFHPNTKYCKTAVIKYIPTHMMSAVKVYLPIYLITSIFKGKIMYKECLRSCLFLTMLQTTCKTSTCIVSNYSKLNKINIFIALYLSGLLSIQFEHKSRYKTLNKYILFQLILTFIKGKLIPIDSDMILISLAYYMTKYKQIPSIIQNVTNNHRPIT